MRAALPAFAAAIPLVFAVAACQVSKDRQNGAVTVAYNQDVAENAAEDVKNGAETLAKDVGNEIDNTADKIDNKVDVDGPSVTINKNAN